MKRMKVTQLMAMALLMVMGATSLPAKAADAPPAAGSVDLNSAGKEALMTLPGVGPSKAEAIIAHRQATPFSTVEDVQQVKGIGPGLYAKIRDFLKVGQSPAPLWKPGETAATKK